MPKLELEVGVPSLAAVLTVLCKTGGRKALARRAVREDLELVEQLLPGRARELVLRMADEKALMYVSRWVGPDRVTRREYVTAFVVEGFGGAVAAAAARFLDRMSE